MLPFAYDPHQETIGISSMQTLLGEVHGSAHFHEMFQGHTDQSSKEWQLGEGKTNMRTKTHKKEGEKQLNSNHTRA